MPSWSVSWSASRTWFVTVRMLEAAVLALTVGAVLTAYHGWRQVTTYGPMGIDGQPDPLSLWQKISLSVAYGMYSATGTTALVVAAVLVLASVVVLHRFRPISHAGLLRGEVAAVGAVQLLVSLGHTLAWVVVAFTQDPNRQEGTITEGGTVTTVEVYDGPSQVETALMNIGLPLTSLVVLAIAALWWLRLPDEFDESDDVDEVADEVDEVAGEGEVATNGDRRPARLRPARGHRTWRPATAQDANSDDIVLDGIELIEPVERLRPREGSPGDGSTPSGYEDYFRRT